MSKVNIHIRFLLTNTLHIRPYKYKHIRLLKNRRVDRPIDKLFKEWKHSFHIQEYRNPDASFGLVLTHGQSQQKLPEFNSVY